MIEMRGFALQDVKQRKIATQIWNAACGADLAIGERFMAYNTRPNPHITQSGQLAVLDGQPVGFVLASAVTSGWLAASPPEGHIDAVAVLPDARKKGVGTALLAWAEETLRSLNCVSARLGASQRPFVPGVPSELGSAAFFVQHGYVPSAGYERTWDMTHDLREYATPSSGMKASGVVVRPAQPGDEPAMLSFLQREFHGGWQYDAEVLLAEGLRLSDYVLLWSERGVDGCCLVTFEDSYRPLDRFYMQRLPHPWGQLGAIGVSADRRGLGYGGALLDGGLRHLRDGGVRGCIIDWLVLVDFYAKFGFKTFREYEMMSKVL
jgi:GNAT superfamily N-acetyltransferase